MFDCDKANSILLQEEERRRLRRERNKVAASKCRNKRKEHIKLLMKVRDMMNPGSYCEKCFPFD